MSEAHITSTIITWIRQQRNGWAIKVHGNRFQSGEPDISACIDGRCIKLEVKTPTGRATKLQMLTLQKWELAGAVTGVVRSLSDVEILLESHSVPFES
jgi:hypothetical protein